jgi:hypothetical protein
MELAWVLQYAKEKKNPRIWKICFEKAIEMLNIWNQSTKLWTCNYGVVQEILREEGFLSLHPKKSLTSISTNEPDTCATIK